MKTKIGFIFCLSLFLSYICCLQINAQTAAYNSAVETQNLNLFDNARQRPIPVLMYLPDNAAGRQKSKKLKIAVISHGYGMKNSDYSFIAGNLTRHGYAVASIQHELPSDAQMPSTGNVYETRKPFWERGVQNILFVISEFKKLNWNLDYNHLLLIGHSNGGDTSILFAAEQSSEVSKVISLDSRRMPFPRQKKPQILSIRSSDQSADPGVLPTDKEQKKFKVKIVKADVIHNDMWDGANGKQKQEITKIISNFLGF